jgi:hypothetical protein
MYFKSQSFYSHRHSEDFGHRVEFREEYEDSPNLCDTNQKMLLKMDLARFSNYCCLFGDHLNQVGYRFMYHF